jgi:Icc-related predicted phosphoesterase
LAGGPYEAGILAGDLLDEWMPSAEVDEWLGQGSVAGDEGRLARALAAKQRQLQGVLEAAGKPLFFVLGNHDVTPWPDTALLTNLHGRFVEYQGWRLAGYRWTRMDRYPHELEADLPALAALVDDRTILVTHSPPWGVLDGVPGGRFRFGLKTLHRLPPPRLHLFGHVHECPGVEGTSVNGAWPALRRFFSIDPEAAAARLVD